MAATRAEEAREAKRHKKIHQMAQEDGGEEDCPLSEYMKRGDNSTSSLTPNQHIREDDRYV